MDVPSRIPGWPQSEKDALGPPTMQDSVNLLLHHFTTSPEIKTAGLEIP